MPFLHTSSVGNVCRGKIAAACGSAMMAALAIHASDSPGVRSEFPRHFWHEECFYPRPVSRPIELATGMISDYPDRLPEPEEK